MKNLMLKFVSAIFVLAFCSAGIFAQGGDAASNDSPEAAEGLDLYAVAELLKDSENLEKFEQQLNDPEKGVNNLDLNEDDAVDFIRVTEQVEGDTHLVVLQTALGDNDFQDVATIAFEKESGENYNLQVQGDASIYGENYYVVPAGSNFNAWNVVRWIFRPNYRPYVSAYGYRSLPRWWKNRRPVTVNVYRARANVLVGRRNFVASRTVRVKTVGKVNYRPRTSTLVTRRTKVTRTTRITGNNRNNQQTTTKTKIVKRKRN